MTSFYQEKWHVARKRHVCKCNHYIEPGKRYVAVAQVFDGDFSAVKLCRKHQCMVAAEWELMEPCEREEGIDYGDIRSSLLGRLRHNRARVITELRVQYRLTRHVHAK